MSIARSLKWLFDRDGLTEEDAEQKRWMERLQTHSDGEAPPPPSLKVEEGTRTFRCKVCGHEGQSPRYCPKCLADTMRPL